MLPSALLRLLRSSCCAALLLLAAASQAARPAAPLPLRLDTAVVPQAATLALTLDPERPRFHGTVEIDVTLAASRSEIVLHAHGLTIATAAVEQGAHRLPARVRPVDGERIALQPARPLPAGKARLVLAFEGRASDVEQYGLFRRPQADAWGLYTQFEPNGARRAFPLFDEPGWKLPWTLSLTVPRTLQALSNMPVRRVDESPSPDLLRPPAAATPTPPRRERRARAMPPPLPVDASGWHTLHFAPTPPLPSYLLAWAVAPLDVRAADGPQGLPMRVATPRGRASEADVALAAAPRVVEWQERFLGQSMPFTQLDSLALPVGRGFGAMEHPGLVTYAAPLLLAAPGEDTTPFRRALLSLVAHETAHMWFGNLVTMRWWDDLWLNESFANWLEGRTADALMPGAGFDLAQVQARASALRVDRLPGGRSVYEPVEREDDFGDLWNSITYDKGQAVLGMAEAWLGAERFGQVLRRYLERHAWGHAGEADFLAALAETDADLARALPGFLRQPGMPMVRVALRCEAGQPPALDLAVQPLQPLGTLPQATRGWTVPLRVRTPAGEARLLLDGPRRLALPDATCPAWVQANAGGTGYWLASPAGDGLRRLATAPGLPAAEAQALLDDAQALHEAGEIDTATVLAVVQAMAGHPRREVVSSAAGLLQTLARLVAPAQAAAYAARWQAAFGARAMALGWQPQPDDTDDTRLLRAELVPLVAEWGEAAGAPSPLRTEALQRARDGLSGPSSIDATLRGPLLATAALSDDPLLFDALVDRLRRAPPATEQRDLLVALGRFRAPALARRARALLLDGTVDVRDGLRTLLRTQAGRSAGRAEALAFVARERGRLARQVGDDEPATWPELFAEACDRDEARAIEQAFGPVAARLQGGRRALQRALDAAAMCGAWREHHGTLPAAPPTASLPLTAGP